MFDTILAYLWIILALFAVCGILALLKLSAKNESWLGIIICFVLCFALAWAINAFAISGDPADVPSCTACQEAFSESYPYCPYCGEAQDY